MPAPLCPDCGAVLSGPLPACPRCELPLSGPLAAELWQVDGALAGLRARQGELTARREHLLSLLRADREGLRADREGLRASREGLRADLAGHTRAAAPVLAPAPRPHPHPAAAVGGIPAPAMPHQAREVSPKAAQNLLLILGGLLLTVAAIVFTLVSWGRLGIGGRAAILLVVTGVTLAVPALLLRRRLTATAETLGLLGLGLMLLDGYAAYQVGLFDQLAAEDYTALLLGVVALAAAGYARALPLRAPLPVAVVLAQLPLVLLFQGSATWAAAALTATAVLDAAVWTLAGRARRAEEGAPAGNRGLRLTAMICLGVVGTLAVTIAGFASVLSVHSPVAALPLSGTLAVLAAVGVHVALRIDNQARFLPLLVAATALSLALAGLVRPLLDDGWRYLPYPVAALVVMALASLLPHRARPAGTGCGGVVALVMALPFVPEALVVLITPISWVEDVWTGPARLWDPQALLTLRPGTIVFALFALACAVLARRWPNPGALVFGTLAVLLVPVAYDLGFVLTVATPTVLALLLSAATVRLTKTLKHGGQGVEAVVWTLVVLASVEALLWALASRSATYLTLAALFAGWAVLTFVARSLPALAGASLAGGGLVWALLAGAGVGLLEYTAMGLSVAAVLALLGGYGMARAGGQVPAPNATVFGRSLAVVLALLSAIPLLPALFIVFDYLDPISAAWEGPVMAGGTFTLAVVVVALSGTVLTLTTRPATAMLVWPVFVTLLPYSVRLPYALVLVVFLVGTAGAALAVARWRAARAAATGAVFWLGTLSISWALAVEQATLLTLPVLAVIAVAVALFGTAEGRDTALSVGAVLVAFEVVAVANTLGITEIEVYATPFAVAALGMGWWRTRGRQVSSWQAYGIGLALGLGPSLLAEATPLRSLLLGVVALAVTLAGVRARRQAPAVLGGATLAVVVLRELAPWIAELAGAVPRWVPIALGGLLLLVVGATYEARKRDVRRVRDAVARLR